MRDPFWTAMGAALMASCCYMALFPQLPLLSKGHDIDTESDPVPVLPLPQAAWPSFDDVAAPYVDAPTEPSSFTVLGYMHLQGLCTQFVRYAGRPDVQRQSCTPR